MHKRFSLALQEYFTCIFRKTHVHQGFPLWLSWERIYLQCGRPGFNPWVGKILWRGERLPTPVFWPREFHGLCMGHKESDTTERLSLSLHLGRKAMTNLDGILKSRDVTLPTKVCLAKAMVFLVVIYGCEGWTIRKAEC